MNNQRFLKKIRFFDIALVLLILIIALVLNWIIDIIAQKSSYDIIIVKQNGAVVLQLTQEEVRKGGMYDFNFDKGVGQIEVKDKNVRMLPMDKKICPLSICSNTGWINGYPRTIICLPNRLSVSFVSNGNAEIDAVSY